VIYRARVPAPDVFAVLWGDPFALTRTDLIAVAAFAGDALAHSVRWDGGGLSALRGRAIRLKFYLSEASLYAFQVTGRI
jgi:hypothetical protein